MAMTLEPDFEKLRRGELYFPLEAAPASPSVSTGLVRFATAVTWAEWAHTGRAELWQVVALATYIDPAGLPWQDLPEKRDSASPAGLFLSRLHEAETSVLINSLRTQGPIAGPVGRSIVRVVDFVRWAEDEAIRLPPLFPSGDNPEFFYRPALPVPGAQAKSEVASSPSAFMRVQEVADFAGFSVATLWRRVKDGGFPASVKTSAGVTAWRRDEVEGWAKARGSSDGTKRAKGKPAKK